MDYKPANSLAGLVNIYPLNWSMKPCKYFVSHAVTGGEFLSVAYGLLCGPINMFLHSVYHPSTSDTIYV